MACSTGICRSSTCLLYTSVETLIALEQRLSDVRYEIESIERSLRNYDMPVSYTHLDVYKRQRTWWIICFLSILAGSARHFLYDLWPNPLTAVFAPVNESVWEHLKLL